jgi:hypothetical protein
MEAVRIETLVYGDSDDIGKPEPFADDNAAGIHDAGESYTDVNGNGTWDANMGEAGLGGPGDIVLYRVTNDPGMLTSLFQEIIGKNIQHVATLAVRKDP